MTATAVARADLVAVGDERPIPDATIIGLTDGQLHFRLVTGREVSRPIHEIEYLQVNGWPLFNLAEKQYRDGHVRQAVASYEKLLAELTAAGPGAAAAAGGKDDRSRNAVPAKPDDGQLDRRFLVQCRLLRAYDREGRFDRAVTSYLEVIERMPQVVETLRPAKLPVAGSTFLEPARTEVEAVIARHGQDAAGVSLAQWLATWPQGRRPATTAPDPTATERPTTPPVASPALSKEWSELRGLTEAGRFDEVLQRIETQLKVPSGASRPDLYYWQGRALLSRSGQGPAEHAAVDRRRAGLALMRVVIHFPGHGLAPECLYRAGEICRQSGLDVQAAGLWQELVRTYPGAAPWTERAQQALRASPQTSPG